MIKKPIAPCNFFLRVCTGEFRWKGASEPGNYSRRDPRLAIVYLIWLNVSLKHACSCLPMLRAVIVNFVPVSSTSF